MSRRSNYPLRIPTSKRRKVITFSDLPPQNFNQINMFSNSPASYRQKLYPNLEFMPISRSQKINSDENGLGNLNVCFDEATDQVITRNFNKLNKLRGYTTLDLILS